MRNVYILAYDIMCPVRYRKVYKFISSYGDPLQYSVFRAELTDEELQTLKGKIWDHLNLKEDRVMIVDLGPIEGRGDNCIEFWGQPKVTPADRSATII